MQAATKPSQMTAESVALQQRLVAKCQENAALLETEVEVLAKGSSDNSRKASRTLGCRMEIAQEALKKAKANLAAAQVALATALARQEEEILPKASPSPGVVPFTAEGDSLCDQSQETSKPGDNASTKPASDGTASHDSAKRSDSEKKPQSDTDSVGSNGWGSDWEYIPAGTEAGTSGKS